MLQTSKTKNRNYNEKHRTFGEMLLCYNIMKTKIQLCQRNVVKYKYAILSILCKAIIYKLCLLMLKICKI